MRVKEKEEEKKNSPKTKVRNWLLTEASGNQSGDGILRVPR